MQKNQVSDGFLLTSRSQGFRLASSRTSKPSSSKQECEALLPARERTKLAIRSCDASVALTIRSSMRACRAAVNLCFQIK